ncbi:uncharacterized protein LOC115890555 [Sitophilus oryzae]|uniref:Uncharacterized protein LOC115890555 n=1 Tax=Sitophilus oryzae TaxID=7048 RepID=A0A6J2YU18_SITOR|nr:uncharacterized protein LOC115890555 [Sitophilus oryzae]
MEKKEDKTPARTVKTGRHPRRRTAIFGKVYKILENYQKNLSSSQRKVLLLVKDYHLVSYVKRISVQRSTPDVMLWCIRFLETNVCFYIGLTLFDIEQVDIEYHLARMLKSFVLELHSLNLTVVCTISPPGIHYSKIMDILMESNLRKKRDKQRRENPDIHSAYQRRIYSDVLLYEVAPVGNILHLYDLYELMIYLQETFRRHREIYFLGFDPDNGSLRHHQADWFDVVSMIKSTKYYCRSIPSQPEISAVIFNLSCHFIVKQAQQSGNLKMTPSMNGSIHLLETLCPLAQSIFHLGSVSPSDLEKLYESLLDVRLILSSMVFKEATDLTTSLRELIITHPLRRRPSITSRVPQLPDITIEHPTPSPSSSEDEEVEELEITFFPNVKENTTKEMSYRDTIYTDFVHHMKYEGCRTIPTDKGKSMRSKRTKYVEETFKTITEQFFRNYRLLDSRESKDKSRKRKFPGSKIVIDPLSPKPSSAGNEEEKINKEDILQDKAKVKKALWKKKKIQSKRRPKPSTGYMFPSEEIGSVKSSTSAASISKSSTSTAGSTTALQSLVSAATSSQSSTPVAPASVSRFSGTTDVKPSKFGESNLKPSTSAPFVPQPSTSAAFVPQPSTSAAFVPQPSTSAADERKSYGILYHQRNAVWDKNAFLRLHDHVSSLLRTTQFVRAPLECLSTIKGFLDLADILRTHNISNIETKAFCLEDVDYFFKTYIMQSRHIEVALQYSVLKNEYMTDISLIDRVLHIPEVLPNVEENVEDEDSSSS